MEQLLYGLMLPSGNDASLALAVWGGRKLLEDEAGNRQRLGSSQQVRSESPICVPKKDAYFRFIGEMNVKAVELNM